MGIKRVLIADSDDEFRALLGRVLDSEEDLSVVAEAADGLQAIDLCRQLVPDVVVTELVLDLADGFDVLRALKELPTRTLVLSAFVRKNLSQEIVALGGDYYMTKPCRFSSLLRRVQLLANQTAEDDAPTQSPQSLECTMVELLREIGVPANILGHSYLQDAIAETIRHPDALKAVSKVLYAHIAQKHGTTTPRVERAIRHAIEVAWSRGSLEVLEKCFGGTISPERGKPTNREFIAILAEQVRLAARQ